MDILKNFGFEPSLFIAQIVNFLILAYVFKRFLYKPILGMLKTREEKIKKGLHDAEQATLMRENAQKQKNELLKQTQNDARSILEDAKKAADDIREQMLLKTKADADKLLKDSKLQADLYMTNMEKRVKIMSVNLAEDLVTKIVQSLFNEDEKERIVKRAVEKIESSAKS